MQVEQFANKEVSINVPENEKVTVVEKDVYEQGCAVDVMSKQDFLNVLAFCLWSAQGLHRLIDECLVIFCAFETAGFNYFFCFDCALLNEGASESHASPHSSYPSAS